MNASVVLIPIQSHIFSDFKIGRLLFWIEKSLGIKKYFIVMSEKIFHLFF